jgi:hypothetical protein
MARRGSERIGKAVADSQRGRMLFLAKTAKGEDRRFCLLRRGADCLERDIPQELFDSGAAGIAFASFDHQG